MKTLNKYPSDQNILCPEYIFYPVGRDSFFVLSNYILAVDHIIKIGKEYALFENTDDTNKKMSTVRLIDCRYDQGIITLIVQELKHKRTSTINHCILPPEDVCNWVLIDSDYFIDKMNMKAIQSYCGDCNEPVKNSNTKINHKSSQDDLLEFEF